MITSLCFVTVAAQRAFYQPGVPVAYLRAVHLTQRGRMGRRGGAGEGAGGGLSTEVDITQNLEGPLSIVSTKHIWF